MKSLKELVFSQTFNGKSDAEIIAEWYAGNDFVAYGRFARIGTIYYKHVDFSGAVGDILGIDFDGWRFCRINWEPELF